MERRPDPDALLASLSEEEKGHVSNGKPSRGRLRVFLGMCPGVGKTYAMLEAGRSKSESGADVVVGLVETHGRRETQALLEGMAILPRQTVDHRGVVLTEFDLDAALKRRPELILLDELAHTNAPGSRHARRWSDAEELLEAGLDVYTTMNVQHVESLNDAVRQITGTQVRETVPDAFLERAEEVVLVDLSPEELLERLREGKVYIPQQAERAARLFFKTSNLLALRELALRFVAERVNVRVLVQRLGAGAQEVWPTSERLMVGVGPAPSSARLLRATKRLAGTLQAPWFALSAETPATLRLPPEARERMAKHLRLAESLGAEVVTASGQDVSEVMLREARARNITKIVVGKPAFSRWRELLRPSPVDRLIRQSGDIDVYVIRGEREEDAQRQASALSWRQAPGAGAGTSDLPASWASPYGFALLAVAVSSLAAWVLYPKLELTDLAMIYVAGVAVAASRGSIGPVVLASALSVLLFNVLFVPPRFTIDVAAPHYLVTFAVMFLVSLGISSLSLRLRGQRDLAQRAEERMAALYRLSHRLAGVRGVEPIARAMVEELSAVFHSEARLYGTGPEEGEPVLIASAGVRPETSSDDAKELAVARWVADRRAIAGRGTETLGSSAFLHIPLTTGDNASLGSLAVRPPEGQTTLYADQIRLLQGLARQGALPLEVERLEELGRQAQIEAENERLRNAILSAVSHDLRTPLASIMGSASALVETPKGYSEETRAELLRAILDEAERLNRLFSNLMELTRLESGGTRLRREAVPVSDFLSAALGELKRRLAGRPVEVAIPADLPFVETDEIALQHVFLNLLDNAAKFSPEGSPIAISARLLPGGRLVEIEVADRGSGLEPGEEEKLFDKFFRGAKTRGARGFGLGLAICRSIVEAHGGKIEASNRPDGGASFRVALPVANVEPPEPEGLDEEEAPSDSGAIAP
jgi:two-component system sensor histidine kinase KdpD